MLKRILIGLGALILLLLLIGVLLPATAHVERSASIDAPAETIFALANSLRRFNEWSPWFEIDPAAEYELSGPDAGVGSRLRWSSKSAELGSGAQEIVASEPFGRVRMRVEFEDQTQAHSELRLTPESPGTRVTWSFDADFGFNLFGRYFGLFLDRVLGSYYEKGLANLKVVAEAEAMQPAAAAPVRVSEVEVSALDIVYVESTAAMDPDSIASALDAAYVEINAFLKENGLEQSGAPLAINRFYDESGWGFDAAVPFRGSDDARARAVAASGTVRIGRTYAGRALKGVHIGSHSSLPDTYRQLEDYMAQNHLEPNGRSWEQYVGDRTKAPEDMFETHVYLPIKPGG
jgi:effector-binding domain-containing protein